MICGTLPHKGNNRSITRPPKKELELYLEIGTGRIRIQEEKGRFEFSNEVGNKRVSWGKGQKKTNFSRGEYRIIYRPVPKGDENIFPSLHQPLDLNGAHIDYSIIKESID